ncbi:IclR family transcriptional regulator [bacterium]|nr:MAG: IclR family transcriptional regulator [bacterium]
MERAQTVERAMRLLAAFNVDEPEMTVAEIARRLDLPRTIVVRLVDTLASTGYLERSARDGRYRIGLAAFKLGSLYAATNPLHAYISSELADLASETGYTAYFGVLDSAEVVIISHHEGRLPIRFVWTAGDRLPAATTALGKAMLSHLNAQQLDAAIGNDRIRGLTEHSLSTRAELDRQLSEIRERGWALARDESAIGITAVGSAVLNAHGAPLGGLSLSFLDYPHDAARLEDVGTIVHKASVRATERVAFYEHYGHRAVATSSERGSRFSRT